MLHDGYVNIDLLLGYAAYKFIVVFKIALY